MDVLFWPAILILSATGVGLLEIILGVFQMTDLKNVPPLAPREDLPKVSVIIPACNEAETIEPALASVLALDYPRLEVLVVNDRSTDETGAVLGRMKKQHPGLRLHEVHDLPDGWLGKSHALQHGAQHARGDYLLFTDADIVMEKTTLSRAMGHLLENGLDHMSLLFKNVAPGGLLNAFMLEGGVGLLWLFKPWQVKKMKSRRFMGVGAFNLVKASVYRAIGGHGAVAMHPIDDIMLGKAIKQAGFSQDCLHGYRFVRVHWYHSLGAMVNGLMKNSFALFNFSVPRVILGLLLFSIVTILPFWAVFFTTGWPRLFFGASVVLRILFFGAGFHAIGNPLRYAIYAPVTPYISIYITLKATFHTLRNRGITWRGTHYALEELRASLF